jgi:DNA-binding NtrC family response regulator
MPDKRKFLIVDDEPANCELLKDFLETRFEDQSDIEIAYNGEQAIEMIEKSPQPDCVLLDIKMPGVDGLQVLKLLKPRYPDINFIMITADRSVTKMMDSIMSEAFDYVPKPVDLDDLEKKILSALSQNK